jgi:hypothetical protein
VIRLTPFGEHLNMLLILAVVFLSTVYYFLAYVLLFDAPEKAQVRQLFDLAAFNWNKFFLKITVDTESL